MLSFCYAVALWHDLRFKTDFCVGFLAMLYIRRLRNISGSLDTVNPQTERALLASRCTSPDLAKVPSGCLFLVSVCSTPKSFLPRFLIIWLHLLNALCHALSNVSESYSWNIPLTQRQGRHWIWNALSNPVLHRCKKSQTVDLGVR